MRTLGHLSHRRAVYDAIGPRLVRAGATGLGLGRVGLVLLHGRPLDDILLELAVVLLQDSDLVGLGLG
jgi:hypothetical protein